MSEITYTEHKHAATEEEARSMLAASDATEDHQPIAFASWHVISATRRPTRSVGYGVMVEISPNELTPELREEVEARLALLLAGPLAPKYTRVPLQTLHHVSLARLRMYTDDDWRIGVERETRCPTISEMDAMMNPTRKD